MSETPSRPPAERFDAERVAFLRREVRAGRFRVNAERVAEQLLAAAHAAKCKGTPDET